MRFALTIALTLLTTSCLPTSGNGGNGADAFIDDCPVGDEFGLPFPGDPEPCGMCIDPFGRHVYHQCAVDAGPPV